MRVGMVTKYPNIKKLHENMGGVASYTKNLIHGIPLKNEDQIIIFANKILKEDQEKKQDSIKIVRCWDEGNLAPFQILFQILKRKNKPDLLHVQYEFFLYGGLLFSLIYPFLLIIFRLNRIPVITTIHQVPPIKNIGKEFLDKNEIAGSTLLFRSALFLLLRMIVLFSNNIIIHEQYFKNILIKQYNCKNDNIVVIPHGIEESVKRFDQEQAKKDLGLEQKKILLFFGYLSGYKGIELLINSFSYLDDSYHLIIAGGKHPRLKNKSSYIQYLEKIKEDARKISNNIEFTGFLKENDIPVYFSAADLIIFPYITHFSSSGPLSLTIAYEKPFIASEVFNDEIDVKEIIFSLKSEELAKKITQFFSNEKMKKITLNFSIDLKKKCTWNNIGKNTMELYNKIL